MKTNTKQGDRNSGNTKQRHQHRHEKGTQRNNGGTVSMKNRNKNQEPRTQHHAFHHLHQTTVIIILTNVP